MLKKIKSLYSIISLDIKNTSINYILKILSSPIILLFIPLYLNSQVQGYWYSFISISALVVFADLGFTQIVMRFAAHEYSFLTMSRFKGFEGEQEFLGRISSLFRFVVKWSFGAVFLVFPIIFIVGYSLFSRESTTFDWKYPWIIYLIASSISFINNIVISFFEGCDNIATTQKINSVGQLIYVISLIILLPLNFNLYAIAVALSVQSLTKMYMLKKLFNIYILQMIKTNEYVYNWRNEILRLLWRYSISFISGYFIFQLFVPLAFKYYGSAFAGKVGITITLVNSIYFFSNIWIYVANPKLNYFVAHNNKSKLNELFNDNLKLSIITFITLSIIIIILFYFFKAAFPNLINRFLDLNNIILLCIIFFLQLLINAMAIYLRAFKEEPLMYISMISAIFVGLSTYLIASYFSSNYYFLGFAISFIFVLPVVTKIYLVKKNNI